MLPSRQLALPLILGLIAAGLVGVAVAQTDSGTAAEVRVWQATDDPLSIHVSARATGGSWDTLGTVPLALDGGLSRDGRYRYGDFAVPAAEVDPQSVEAPANDGVISGVVHLRRGAVTLPAGVVVTIQLLDGTRERREPAILGEQVVTGVSRLPVAFDIAYDAASIEPYAFYTLEATVHLDGQLLYFTEVMQPVLSYDYPADSDVEVVAAQGTLPVETEILGR